MTNTRFTRSARVLLVLGLVAASIVVASPGASAKPLRTKNFQMPSGNIGCHLGFGQLRCDILSGLNPEPQKECEQDWVGLTFFRSKGARATCAGDTVFKQDSPVLKYGRHWKTKRIDCVSRQTGLKCRNASGYSFKLARDSWSRSYSP